jgi:hypothetical protein
MLFNSIQDIGEQETSSETILRSRRALKDNHFDEQTCTASVKRPSGPDEAGLKKISENLLLQRLSCIPTIGLQWDHRNSKDEEFY